MSGYTGLTLIFTKPDGTTLTKTEASSNAVDAPAVALISDPDLGDQPASTYFEFSSIASDFDQPGTWYVCGIYTDATRTYHTEAPAKSFTVLEACS